MKVLAHYPDLPGGPMTIVLSSPRKRRRYRADWTRLADPLFPAYGHVSGWQVQHCGHQTALWPYHCVPPAGVEDSPLHARTFGTLIEAMRAIESVVQTVRAAQGGIECPKHKNP